jgi:hypothetical protein
MNKRDLTGFLKSPKSFVLAAVRIDEKSAKFVLNAAGKFFYGNWSETQRRIIQFASENKEMFYNSLKEKKNEDTL